MGLFFLSLILTVLSGYFITSIFEQKNFIKIFIYMCAVMFASIVLNVEILSLINSISQVGILVINTIFAIASGIVWYKQGRPLFKINAKKNFKKVYYAVMSDKYLLVLGLSFLFMLSVSLFLIAIMPVVNSDAESYHVLRSLFWIGNKNLNHFAIGDIRNLVMPINSEILYLWLFVFLKKQLWLGIFPFVGFLLSIFSVYGILDYTRFSERHKLWTIFLLSSFPSVIVLLSGTETDLIISGLVLSSIYLFWSHLKSKRLPELYFSSLVYALAIGTKTPALMLMFPVGLWMLWMSRKTDKENHFRIVLSFLGFGLINFVIFSSYNYVLNFLDFGNIFGPKSFLQVHNNLYGIKGTLANFIKHIFLFFDFTGFHFDKIFGGHIVKLRTILLSILNLSSIPDGHLTSDVNKINHTLCDNLAGLGLLGIFVFLPCWVYSFIKPLFRQDNKTKIIFSFGLILLGTIFVMSCVIPFMTYNIRFLTSFCVVGAPILVYSYSRKNSFWKFLITMLMLFGLLLISRHIWRANFVRIISHLKRGYSISQIRSIYTCHELNKEPPVYYGQPKQRDCIFNMVIRRHDRNLKILYFPSQSEDLLTIKQLNFYGYNIDFALLEDIESIDLNYYDIIYIRNMQQWTSVMKHADKAPAYSPAEGVNCKYEDVEGNEYRPDTGKAPYLLGCEVEEKFFKQNRFKLENTYTLQYKDNKGTIFYEWRKKN